MRLSDDLGHMTACPTLYVVELGRTTSYTYPIDSGITVTIKPGQRLTANYRYPYTVSERVRSTRGPSRDQDSKTTSRRSIHEGDSYAFRYS